MWGSNGGDNMKKILILFLTILLAFSFASCQKNNSENINLKVCGSYAVPGMFYADMKGMGATCEPIERDSFGRILYTYSTRNFLSEIQETVYVICQKYDSEYVYFYEDICYLPIDRSDDELETLKTKNDWDKELDLSKMSRRTNDITFDLVLNTSNDLVWNKAENVWSKALGVEVSDIKEMCIVDEDPSGNVICFSKVSGLVDKRYFVFCSSEYEIEYMEIKSYSDLSELYSFKAKCGWEYGFNS